MTARLKLRRDDGRIYLRRIGFEHPRIGGVFIHRMSAPDPGLDLHNHPWRFWSVILWGGYVERRRETARSRSSLQIRGLLSLRAMRLRENHRIVSLLRGSSWSLVIHGPHVRSWGFFTPDGFVDWQDYDQSRRGLGEEL